jgi:hypothetical protein
VKNLTPITDDPLVTYRKVAEGRGDDQSILRKLTRRIRGCYRWYDKRKPELHVSRGAFHPSFTDDEKKALIHCYVKAPRCFAETKKEIRRLIDVCPYCTILSTQTLDHYLPKHEYPEFSVLSQNLIPSCGTCNFPRDFRTKAGERALIHPYFDTIPQERLLVATVRMVGDTADVTFSVDQSGCKDSAPGLLYKRHFELLKLKERYRKWAMSANGVPTIFSASMVWARGKSCAEVRQDLEIQASLDEPRRGANDFRVALTRGVAGSDDYLDYCLGSMK